MLDLDVQSLSVLDVGCGTGIFIKPLIEAGCDKVYGVDGPQEYVSHALKRGYKDVFIVDDLNFNPIPLESESFDLVICKDVFEHLHNPLAVLEEIRRVLKVGGYFLFHVPNHFPLMARIKFLFSNDIDTFSFFSGDSRWTYPHIRFYEHKDSSNIFKKHKFLIVTDLSFHFHFIPFISRFKFFNKFSKLIVRKFPNHFSMGYTYLLKKMAD